MRLFTLILIVVLVWAQNQLWFGKNGLVEYRQVSEKLLQQQAENEKFKERNALLKEEIKDLKSGLEAIEELARSDLGFIKPGETFYRVIPQNKSDANNANTSPNTPQE